MIDQHYKKLVLFFFCLPLVTNGQALTSVRLTDEDAALLVKADAQAEEARKDALEKELTSAKVIEAAYVDLGTHRIFVNSIEPPKDALRETLRKHFVASDRQNQEEVVRQVTQKNVRSVSLTGVVWDDGAASEIWWTYEGERYKIVTNANFLYFQGIRQVEEKESQYLVSSLVTQGNFIYIVLISN
jgi:hypothetical protein